MIPYLTAGHGGDDGVSDDISDDPQVDGVVKDLSLLSPSPPPTSDSVLAV